MGVSGRGNSSGIRAFDLKIIMPPQREHPPLTRSARRGKGRSQHRQLDPIEGESAVSTIRAAPAAEQIETHPHTLSPLPPTIPPVALLVPPSPPPVPPPVLDVSIPKKLKEARKHGCVSFMGELDATVAKEVVQMALRAKKLANENRRMQAELAKRRNLRVLRCAGDTYTTSRRDGSPDASHSISEGSLDSTAKSRWQPEPSCPKSADSNNINVSIRGCGRNVRGQLEKNKEKVTVASKPLRKVSGVRHFPSGCGRNAAPVSDEEYRRIQQAWIEEQRRKSQEKEDPLMCPDQDNEEPKDV
ncbi:Uncharacterized protein TCM_044456 [Theobroma cacao]|uniref:Uncharacterized protein n=1 Tax=Theobroma cacao TaxID=3641 RepID=A0A061FQL1_THECC|nr:Uncharacterized protein TCM_044456 [Theobroma cacao]